MDYGGEGKGVERSWKRLRRELKVGDVTWRVVAER